MKKTVEFILITIVRLYHMVKSNRLKKQPLADIHGHDYAD